MDGPTRHASAAHRHVTDVLVLAAGASSRMGDVDKLAILIHDRSLLGWTVHLAAHTLVDDGLDARIHVVRRMTPDGVASIPDDVIVEVADLPGVRLHVVAAPNAHRGVAWSLRDAAAALLPGHPDLTGVCIVQGDDPLAALALADVARRALETPDRLVVVDRGSGGSPQPVHVPRRALSDMVGAEPARPDSGLRDVLADAAPLRVTTAAPDPMDVDEISDVRSLAAALSSSTWPPARGQQPCHDA